MSSQICKFYLPNLGSFLAYHQNYLFIKQAIQKANRYRMNYGGKKILPVDSTVEDFPGEQQSQDGSKEIADSTFETRSNSGNSKSQLITLDYVYRMIDMFREGKNKMIPEREVQTILSDALEIVKKEPSLVPIKLSDGEKLTICGDIHGQFFDLMNIFDMNNFPKPTNPYLFNGDIVDRGAFSVECILTLLCFKILYPNKFYIARGNHESAETNMLYGFQTELSTKYPKSCLLGKFQEVFNWLPIAHLVNGKIFVVHGGLSRQKELTLDRVLNIPRGKEPSGLMAELLWSDPSDALGIRRSHRGIGVLFGPDVTDGFCSRNGIELIVRSHEVQMGGYSYTHESKILTVFSAPNYCDVERNSGAYLVFKGDTLKPEFHVFNEAYHPESKNYVDI